MELLLSWYFWSSKNKKLQGVIVKLTGLFTEDSKVKNFTVFFMVDIFHHVQHDLRPYNQLGQAALDQFFGSQVSSSE